MTEKLDRCGQTSHDICMEIVDKNAVLALYNILIEIKFILR